MKFIYEHSGGLSEEMFAKAGGMLEPYIRNLQKAAQANDYRYSESSINLPFDGWVMETAQKTATNAGLERVKYIIVVGIGGSNLGAKAVYDALYGYFDVVAPERLPKMIWADTVDPEFLEQLEEFFIAHVEKPEAVLVNVVSKSGGTTETIANFEMILAMAGKFKHFNQRIVVSTDFESKLWNAARQLGMLTLEVPDKVGGRYSVFSIVGLLPLAACGIDVAALVVGAQEAREQCLAMEVGKNPAALSASYIFYHYKKGMPIHDTFFFHPELESLGKWYRQLMGESIGKEKDIDGNPVRAGITPTVSIGSTDLHSVAQLYLGGPKDKSTTFVWTESSRGIARVPKETAFPELVSGIAERSAREIMEAIYEGVKIAYQKNGLPFVEVILPDLSARSLGAFMQFKMIEMMMLGYLMRVNAFDQPNVESYKIETKKILQAF